jgi:signal peptidase II
LPDTNDVLHRREIIFIAILTAAWLLDRVTKFFALAYLPTQTIYRNYGMTFDLLKDNPSACLILALSSLAFFVVVFARHKEALFTPGTALLFAGALGNLADRLIYGYVVDWIHFVGYINMADVWLGFGVLLLFRHFSRKVDSE